MQRWLCLCLGLGLGCGDARDADGKPDDAEAPVVAKPDAAETPQRRAAAFFGRPGSATLDEVDWVRLAQIDAMRAVAQVEAAAAGARVPGLDAAALSAESMDALASLDYEAEAKRAAESWSDWKGADACTAAKAATPKLPTAELPGALAEAVADLEAGQTWTIACGKLEGDLVVSVDGTVIGMTVPLDPARVEQQVEAAGNRFVGYMNQPDE
jgi:hypothetical protein